MNSVVLVPYCPLPADNGSKVEMLKYLKVLQELGSCTLVSARSKPVGAGWTEEACRELREGGFVLRFREDDCPGRSLLQLAGILYASVMKGLKLEKAFGHSNPYHRYAFPGEWWKKQTRDKDVAIIFYSYWAHLPCECPKALVLLDLYSNFMWEGVEKETMEIRQCDHTFVISMDEFNQLQGRGVANVTWSPPAVPAHTYPDSVTCGLVGSDNDFNLEGLRWLEKAGGELSDCTVQVYGSLSRHIKSEHLIARGRYEKDVQPYEENGVLLLLTVQGMGVQIKSIEALASGRAIIARKGAVRGLPDGKGYWIEVETPAEALQWMKKLQQSEEKRKFWSRKSLEYHRTYLDSDTIRMQIAETVRNMGG